MQTIGRAARHIEGHVVMYADKLTDSMRHAISETNRRRIIQRRHNEQNGIVPQSISKAVKDITDRVRQPEPSLADKAAADYAASELPKDELTLIVKDLEKQMKRAALELEFEAAAVLRDQITDLRKLLAVG